MYRAIFMGHRICLYLNASDVGHASICSRAVGRSWRLELQREKQELDVGESFHPLVHFPDGCNMQFWPREARSSTQVTRVGGRDLHPWGISCCFSQDTSKELDWEWNSHVYKPVPTCDAGIAGSGFTC